MAEAEEACGAYRLRERIGAGGMGEIFRAEAPDGAPVAIKRLLPECARDPVFVGMFLDEARLASRLRHPNISEVYGHGREGERYYLVMELVDGPSLRELLERRAFRGLPFGQAARVLAEVAAGLDHAHRLRDEAGEPLGVVHRDVSPANILIDKRGRVKVVDFGLAKARTQLVKTQPGLVKGKFGYLAPEQLGGRIDWRTDLFQMGLCLYEALTGQPLFDQRTAAETVTAIGAFTGPPPIEGAPPGLDAVLRKVLAVDPADRYESASAFRAALGEVVVRSGEGAVGPERLAALVRDVRGPLEPRTPAAPTPREPAPAPVPDEPELVSEAAARPRWPLWGIAAAALALALAGLALALGRC